MTLLFYTICWTEQNNKSIHNLLQFTLPSYPLRIIYSKSIYSIFKDFPDSKVRGTNMGPTWVLSAPDGPMLSPWTLISGMINYLLLSWLRSTMEPVLCHIGYPFETYLKSKSRQISFAHNLLINYPVDLRFFEEYGSYTAVLCAKIKSIGQLKRTRWTDDISRDFRQRAFVVNGTSRN